MPDPPGERVLIPGANGFFGTWIARTLERSGHEVVGRTGSELDLTDAPRVRREVAATEPTVIVNAAGISSPARARRDPTTCFRVNTGGVLNLLEAARRAAPEARLINLSSAAVYAPSSWDRPVAEDQPVAAGTPYAASKLAAELLCGQYARERRMRVATLRVFNLIGPGQSAEQAAGEFTLAVARALEEGRSKVVIPVGSPSTSRDFTDVRDAADAVCAVIERQVTGVFNLCSGRAVTLAELAAALEGAARERVPGFTVDLSPEPRRIGASDPGRLVGAPLRLERATGWRAVTPLRHTVASGLESAPDRSP